VPYRLAELAELIGGRVAGDPERLVESVQALETAGPRDLALFKDPRYRGQAAASAAGVLLVGQGLELPGRDLLVAADPGAAFGRLLGLFHPVERRVAGIHPTAVVEEGAEVDPTAHIGPYAVLGAGCRIGPGAAVLAHGVVGRRATVGEGAVLHPHVVLYDRTEVGPEVEVHAGAVLGSDGFGYATARGVHHKVPQVGRVVIEEGVEIGANSTIDRATLGETRIGAGTKIDNLVQVGHNVEVGPACLLCGQAGIAGSTRLGAGVVLAGQAGVAGHLRLADGVQVAAKSAALSSVESAGPVAGIPAVPLGKWRRQAVLISQLEEMSRRLRGLTLRVAELAGAAGAKATRRDE
jgi:UDP-3-O-[3-hydroxymyristoyl] glucosamine N-acyltransferase